MAAVRITETELILPSLYLMTLNGGSITTADLIPKLRQIMKPTGEDLQILTGRKDDKFSQKVRNLKAHGTFERFGYAIYSGGYANITESGKMHLKNHEDILKYLLINDFTYSDLTENLKRIEADPQNRKIETFDENIIIQEGIKSITESVVYERSKQLRDYALYHFMEVNEGKLDCAACKFNFSEFYGNEIGNGFIEIHHIKPIFYYAGDDYIKIIKDAITNLMPVCSNCHRMIHRNWSKPLEIKILIESINDNGIFRRFNS